MSVIENLDLSGDVGLIERAAFGSVGGVGEWGGGQLSV